MRSCSASIGCRNLATSDIPVRLLVVNVRQRLKLRRLLFRRSIVEKISSTDLRAGEVLQETGFAQRRMNLDVKMKAALIRTVRGRLVQDHHVRKRHAPQILQTNERLAEDGGEILQFVGSEIGDARSRRPRRDVRLVRVPRKEGNK